MTKRDNNREDRSHLRLVPDTTGRVPPHDLDAESAVLSAVLEPDRSAFDLVAPFLRAEMFYSEANRRIYEACQGVRDEGRAIDSVIVAGWLRTKDRLQQVGGAAYLAQLVGSVPSVANVMEYVGTIVEKWRIRCLIAKCQQIAAEGYGDVGGTEEYGRRVATEIDEIIAKNIMRETGARIGPALSNLYKRLQTGRVGGVECSTGFLELDEILVGMHGGELTMIAARPGMGKTALALCLARNVAYIYPEDEVVFSSIEMQETQIVSRMACVDGGIDAQRMRKQELTVDEWSRMASSLERMAKLCLWIDDQPLDMPRLRSMVRQRMAYMKQHKGKVRLVVVDYLQIMKGPGDDENERYTEITKEMKALAKELDVPIVLLCQLTRGPEGRADKRPELSDLRGSGAIEQNADNVWFVYRSDYYERDEEPNGEAEIIVAKQRGGPPGKKAHLRYYASCTRFDNV